MDAIYKEQNENQRLQLLWCGLRPGVCMHVSGGTAWPATAAARRLRMRNRRARRLGIDHVRATVHARGQGNYKTLLLLHGPGYLFVTASQHKWDFMFPETQ
jgi:hypothetical protein